jgi:hypothetical protein
MIDVVGCAEPHSDEIRDSRAGPRIRGISGGSSPLEQCSFALFLLPIQQLPSRP